MIPIKTPDEIAAMRNSCRIAANILEEVCRLVEPGVNTYDLDQTAKRLMNEYGARSACYDYQVGSRRFPAYTCLSLNDEVVHGIGSLKTVLREGDILSVDVSINYNGFIGDNARTVSVGEVSEEVEFLLRSTEEALFAAIDEARPGNRVGYISNRVETYIRARRLGIVREFVGHGVGRMMHEEPQIPNFGPRKRGDVLKPGMTLAIEPMVTLGAARTELDSDGWTARTTDHRPAAHFEHTVLVTPGAPEILTVHNV